MIYIRPKGGLGNQLWQIASVAALAWDNDGEYAVDFSGNCPNQGRPPTYYKDNILHKVPVANGYNVSSIYHEGECREHIPLEYRDNTLFDGYFQDYRYLLGYDQPLINLFTNTDKVLEVYNKFDFTDSVAVHVRRGDYLRFPSVYNILGMDYYNKAIRMVGSKNIFVCSDDMAWCKDNFKGVTFVEGLSDWEELYLMSLCDNNIIANSSFSWWGAYLNQHDKKKIIAPKLWSLNCKNEGIHTLNMVLL